MKIGVDVDDVLAVLSPALIDNHNKIHGTSYVMSDFLDFKLENTWGQPLKEAVKEIDGFLEKIKFDLEPINGSIEAINKLSVNNEIFIITSRAKEHHTFTVNWLKKYFPNKFAGIYLANNFFPNGNKIDKKDICELLLIDVLVEDYLHQAIACAPVVKNVILFNYPWNQSKNLPKNIIRVKNWKEAIDFVEKAKK